MYLSPAVLRHRQIDEDDDNDDDDDEEEEEEEDDHWDLDYSKSNDYSDWPNNAMINDYTPSIICIKNQLLYADILNHIRKHTIHSMQNSVHKEDRDVYKFEHDLQPSEPDVGIETGKKRYREAVDMLLVPSN